MSLATPILYEQFPWQESMYEELARSHALMVEGLGDVDTQAISAQQDSTLTKVRDGTGYLRDRPAQPIDGDDTTVSPSRA